MTNSSFELVHQDGLARAGLVHTAHGTIPTPMFMPVGTVGSVKALAPDDLSALGAPIILGNTYHLYLRPGDGCVARMGGLHRFASWNGAILTDSGGFQVFSLQGLRKITDDGVEFRSHLDGSKHFFSPEKVLTIQQNLGSDIWMPLDECVAYGADYSYTKQALERTLVWAKRSREEKQKKATRSLLFGIVQGGFFADLRREAASAIIDLDFDGIAIGGLSVGESKAEMAEFVASTCALLPLDKPHYLMGVGTPVDLVTGIAHGIDLFDCVLPTRNARNGTLYTSQGKINIKRREFAEDERPLDPNCGCYTCRTFSRGYLRHLFVSQELLALRLNSLHNLTYYLDLVRKARKAILEGTFVRFADQILATYPEESEKLLS